MKKTILICTLLCVFCLPLMGCVGGSTTVFEKVNLHMTMEEVEAALGTPDKQEDTYFYYYDVPLGSLSGTVEICFYGEEQTLSKVYWWFDTGAKTTQDYAKETQEIYDLFTEKYGEAGLYEGDSDTYCWYEYESGGTRFLLFTRNQCQICLFADYD